MIVNNYYGSEEVEEFMADIRQALAELKTSVAAVADRVANLTGPLQNQINDLQVAIQAEREAADALRNTEEAEDVQQNQALADAQAATDAALQEASDSAVEVETETSKLNQIAV